MIYLRQSTASQEVPLGYFVDSTDGNTEETALTIANTDIKIWKTGATTLANKNSGGGTHISNGIYYAVLDATDTNTIGPLVIFVHVSGALTVRVECCVLDEAVYDVLFGTTALATVSNITGGTITTATNVTTVNGLAANVITATSIAANAITSAKVADGFLTAAKFAAGAFDAVWTVTTRTLTGFSTALALSVWHVLESAVVTASTMGLKVKTNLDAAITSRSSHSAADVWDNGTRTLTAGTNIVLAKGTGVTGFNDLSAAQVNAEVDTALADIHLDHLLAVDYDPATPPGTATALLNELVENDGGVSRFSANALEQGPAGGGGLTQQQVRDAMKLAPTAGAPSAGSVDEHLDDILTDTAEIGAAGAGLTAVPWNIAWDTEVQSEVTDALNVYDPPTKAELDSAHATTDALIGTVDTVVDAILVDTAEIGVAGAGLTEAGGTGDQLIAIPSVGSVTGSVGSVTGSVGSVTSRVTANVDQLNGDAVAAATLAILNGVAVVYRGTVTGVATTTTLVDSGLTQADTDWWKGRIIIFTSVIPLQATDITGFTPATDTLTFTATTQAPTGATYVII